VIFHGAGAAGPGCVLVSPWRMRPSPAVHWHRHGGGSRSGGGFNTDVPARLPWQHARAQGRAPRSRSQGGELTFLQMAPLGRRQRTIGLQGQLERRGPGPVRFPALTTTVWVEPSLRVEPSPT
jgi:hypothetical protein